MSSKTVSSKLVTIGLPCFNGERYLKIALDSIRAQDHEPLEIIVADNASTDGSVEIAREAAAQDDRVTVLLSDRNHGAAWNYNRLVDAARGTYFKWAAHDDVCEPTLVSSCVATLEANPGAVVAYPQDLIIDADGEVVRVHDEDLGLELEGDIRRAAQLLWRVRMCHAVFGVMRLEVLRETELIQPFDSSDVALLAELALRGPILQTEGRLFHRRRHDHDSRSVNATSADVAKWFAPEGAPRGRSRPLLRSYFRTARRWAPDTRSAIAATAMFATVGPLSELRWHRRARRRAKTRGRRTGER